VSSSGGHHGKSDRPDPFNQSDSKLPAVESQRNDEEICAAIEEIIAERPAYWEALKPPELSEQADAIMQPAAITSCPFPQALLTRHFGYGIPLTADEKLACDQARSLTAGTVLQRNNVACTPVSVSLLAGQQPAYDFGYFGHAELRVWSHAVHGS
jgi:hypothetical protein